MQKGPKYGKQVWEAKWYIIYDHFTSQLQSWKQIVDTYTLSDLGEKVTPFPMLILVMLSVALQNLQTLIDRDKER